MRNKIFLAVSFVACGIMSPAMVRADADLIDRGAGMTINTIGVSAGADGTAHFDLAEYPAAAKGCTWEKYYINLNTPAGVATYATLLNAHNRGKKLSRLHFFQANNGGTCTVNLIELKM